MGLIKKFFEEITFFGGIAFYLFLIIFFFLVNAIIAFQLALGLAVIYFLTFIIRVFYFKPRPKIQEYSGFFEKIDASSFPSVHAARATFLLIFIIFSPLSSLLFPAIVVWLLVLYSRYYLKKHDLIDLAAGIILGILSFAVLAVI